MCSWENILTSLLKGNSSWKLVSLAMRKGSRANASPRAQPADGQFHSN